MLDTMKSFWYDLFPPVRTPEEVMEDEQERLADQQNRMVMERWQIDAESRRADHALKKAAETRHEEEIRYAATRKVALIQRRQDWTERADDLLYTQQNLTRMQDDSLCTTATLNMMNACNATAVDPVRATRTLSEYQMRSQQAALVNELVREAMETRREEQAEARAEKNGSTEAAIARVEQQTRQQGNQLLLHSLPPINSQVLSPGLMSGSKQQLQEQVREGQRRTDAFLAATH